MKLHLINFDYVVCKKWWSIKYFFYNCYQSFCRNSKYNFYFNVFITTGIIKKLLSKTRNKKKKYYKTLVLPNSTLNSIETLVSHALIDKETSHE